MSPKRFFYILLVALMLASCNNKAIVTQPDQGTSFRVLGYLHSPRDWMSGLNAIDLSGITDLNLAFINPDSTGMIESNENYRQLINKAHAEKVRVYLSIGGGSPPDHLEALMTKEMRPLFIAGLVSAAENYGFDGIDVDLENSLINLQYAPFVSELAAALKPRNILMTAALASWNAHLIHDSTLALYDFINIMSYDKTGPWNLSKPGQHSPFSMVSDDFTYFNQARKISAGKLLIGLPFYGYGFGTGAPQSMSYKNIVNLYNGAEQTDSVQVAGGGFIYYNGMPTIRQKVSFARDNKAAGVMIWQLLGDIRDKRSLLGVINEHRSR